MISAYPPRTGAARRALSLANAAAGLLLLVAGGLVTSTASGLAVPDWPLSFGGYFPRMTGGVLFEHGHRVFAGFVGLAILGMAALTQREEPRPWVRRLAWATALCVLLQAALGGVTVLYGLPVSTSAAHATLGQTVFVLLVLMADAVGEPRGAAQAHRPAGGLRWLALLAAAALWTQLLLGSVLRHGGSRLLWHLLGAVAASASVLWLSCAALSERDEPELRRPAALLAALLTGQLLLGGLSAALRLGQDPRTDPAMIAASTSHLAVGALMLGCAALLAARLWRQGAR